LALLFLVISRVFILLLQPIACFTLFCIIIHYLVGIGCFIADTVNSSNYATLLKVVIMKRLQVKQNNVWKYVFGYKGGTKELLTLRDDQRNIALQSNDLSYFQAHYTKEFRVI
jgi:hypothetical protein